MKKQTIYTLLVIVFGLSFFVTPLGDYSKLQLNRLFASQPTVISPESSARIQDYNWKLKDADWNYFNFKKSEGKVVFINFWASWHLPSRAQLKDIEKLYERYKGEIDFYLITDEEKEPVEAFMAKNKYNFPVTYQIIGEASPIKLLKPSGCYLIDKNGLIRIHQNKISDWDNKTVHDLIQALIVE